MRASSVVLVTRWVARFWSVLNILIVLIFVVGAIGSSGPAPTLHEWVGLALWPIGVVAGLIVAWYREKLGGILALLSLIAFYVWNLLRSGHPPKGPFFFLLAAPALVFLIAGFASYRNADTGA